MQPLAATSSLGTAYSAAQVFGYLCSSGREDWVFDLLADDLRWKGDLTPYVLRDPTPQIKHDARSNSVKRTFNFSTRAGSGINPYQDLVRPRFRLSTPDGGYVEWVEGTFQFSLPKRQITEAATIYSWSCADLAELMNQDEFLVAYSVDAAASYVGAIRTINSTIGPTPIFSNFPDPGKTLPNSLVWDSGKAKLTAVNDMLEKITYRPAWFDEWGQQRSNPIPDYNVEPQVGPTWDAANGISPILGDPIQDDADDTAAFNIIKVIGQDPRTPTVKIEAVYENVVDTPIGTSNTRKRVKVIQDSTIADYESAYARARAEAQAAARAALGTVSLNTVAWPVSQDFDVYHITWNSTDGGIEDWRYLELGWTMNCVAGGSTAHLLERIVNT